MKKIYTLAIALFATFAFGQTTITHWDFNADTPAEAMLPTIGEGTFTLIGGVEDNLTNDQMPSGVGEGKAYSITSFPEQGEASGTAGFQFEVSTVGYSDITVSFFPRTSNTGSKWQEYILEVIEEDENGETSGFTQVVGNNDGMLVNSFSTDPIVITLPASANDKEYVTFKIVSIFEPETSEYAPLGNNYGTGGAWRIDDVIFAGTANSVSVKDNNISGLSVYPNPVATGTLYITSDNSVEKAVAIFDVLGKQVVNATTANGTVNVSNLNAGVYIVKVTEEGKTATRKLVVK